MGGSFLWFPNETEVMNASIKTAKIITRIMRIFTK
jgi:hypothetical protein